MDEFPTGPNDKPQGQGPRKSSDVLGERLAQVRRRAEELDRQYNQAGNGNREQQELFDSPPVQNDTRNVELEAELQALRQETALMRNAVKEKDKVVEELAAQCRGLEDVLEDRDREMDRLQRELEQTRSDRDDADPTPAGQPRRHALEPDSDPLYRFQEKDSGNILDGSDLIFVSGPKRPWKLAAAAAVGGLILGMVVLEAFFVLSDRGGFFTGMGSSPPQGAQVTPTTGRTPVPTQSPPTPSAAPSRVAAGSASSSPTRETAPADASDSTPAAAPTLKDRLRDGSPGPTMVRIGGGSFQMGGRRGIVSSDDQPAHEVRIGDFYIGKYEVTFEEYDRFAKATGRELPDDAGWGRGRRPVINVTWDDAREYARWLSRQTGATYRLPSESEWEYAARGGSENRYWWGFSPQPGMAVCFDCGTRWDKRSTAPVGSLPANGFGLHEVAGNALEWVADCYNPSYRNAPTDGSVWQSGDCSQRMARGGAFNKPASSLRSTTRSHFPKDARFNMVGFRLVRE